MIVIRVRNGGIVKLEFIWYHHPYIRMWRRKVVIVIVIVVVVVVAVEVVVMVVVVVVVVVL